MVLHSGRFALSVLLTLLWGPAIAAPQVADPEKTIDTVEVTARREAMRKAIATYVSTITRWDGENVARWRDRICPSVSGATPEQGEFIRSRVLEVAAAVGAPVSDDKKCKANLLVILTGQPDQLWAAWRKRYPKMFSAESPENIERILDPRRPVVTWQNATLNNADGTAPKQSSMSRAAEHRLIDSRIRSSVSEDIFSVVVVVNTSATGGATFGQLADYLAVVSLARIDPRIDLDGDFANASSILRLFAKSSASAPKNVTAWDQAFLKALYRSFDPLLQQRSFIMTSMSDDLAK